MASRFGNLLLGQGMSPACVDARVMGDVSMGDVECVRLATRDPVVYYRNLFPTSRRRPATNN